MKRRVVDEIKKLCLGDLVSVEWYDASVGKSLASGTGVDVLVQSWGIYLGVLGIRAKHLILAQNNFRFADGLYDLDYTAIPLPWSVSITVVLKNNVSSDEAKQMLNSFLVGGRRTIRSKKRQQKVRNHNGRLD